MGHTDTLAAQTAHKDRWRQGRSTTARGRARQTTHDTSSSPSWTVGGGEGAATGGVGPAGMLGTGWAAGVAGAWSGAALGVGGRSQARARR